jgi:putative acetyltransferase
MANSRTAELRPARAADEHAVFAIYTHASVERFLTFDGVDRHRFNGIFSQFLEDGDFFLYEVDGEVAAFCKATRLPGRASHVAHLGPLAVAPELQGRGYGASMLRAVFDRLEPKGVLRFQLMVEADNPRGIAFYRKVGFEQEGVQRKAYKRAAESHYVDELLMVRFAESPP